MLRWYPSYTISENLAIRLVKLTNVSIEVSLGNYWSAFAFNKCITWQHMHLRDRSTQICIFRLTLLLPSTKRQRETSYAWAHSFAQQPSRVWYLWLSITMESKQFTCRHGILPGTENTGFWNMLVHYGLPKESTMCLSRRALEWENVVNAAQIREDKISFISSHMYDK